MTNELMKLDGVRGTITEVGWDAPEGITQQEADEVLVFASRTNTMTAWLIGDVLARSPQSWGMYDKAIELTGYSKGTLQVYMSVAKSVKSLNRFKDLGIAHHMLVASLPEDDQRYWLSEMSAGGWSVARAREEMKAGQIVDQEQEFPVGVYSVLYADPPWSYDNSGFTQSAAQQYPTMTVDDICALPVPTLAPDNSVLFLWVTSPLLPDGLRVMEAWGFDYKASMTWVKNRAPGIGWWVNTYHEVLLIGGKGENTHPAVKFDSVFYGDVAAHSAKPQAVYDMIEKMYSGPKIELFARNSRPGWSHWGNEDVE